MCIFLNITMHPIHVWNRYSVKLYFSFLLAYAVALERLPLKSWLDEFF